MALWRCPHCGTLQPVAARCWVCRRSSTSCGTCRHFRASVAARIGYCGLDRDRRPLAGGEIRACWDGAALVDDEPMPAPEIAVTPAPSAGYMGGFVPVESMFDRQPAADDEPAPVAVTAATKRDPDPLPPPPAVAPPDGLFWADLEG